MNELIPISAISPLRQRLIDDMTMRRFGPETQRNYLQPTKPHRSDRPKIEIPIGDASHPAGSGSDDFQTPAGVRNSKRKLTVRLGPSSTQLRHSKWRAHCRKKHVVARCKP